jgi:hypothetical protein
MKLYELTDAYCSVLEELSDPSADGEDATRYHDLLSGLGGAFDEKVLSIAKIVRSMEADVAALAAEMERLQGRKRHLAGRIDWLKRYLLGEMEAVGRERVAGPTMTVSLAKAPPSCEVVSVEDVPAEFRRVRVEVDRSLILEHFRQTGEVVPGTTVAVDRRYVRIS